MYFILEKEFVKRVLFIIIFLEMLINEYGVKINIV